MLRTNCKKIYDFLNKWYKLFKDDTCSVNELLDISFEEKCEEFGFYEDYDRLINDNLLSIEGISEYIQNCEFDLDDAASILYGNWYWYRYLDFNKGMIKDPKTRRWFTKVLKWMLTNLEQSLKMDYGKIVSCKIKTTIFETDRKNNGIEEILTIKNEGKVKRSLKKAGSAKAIITNLTADRKKLNEFINSLSKCFVYGVDAFSESRYGSVEVEFTNSEKIKYRFFCGLRTLLDEEGNNLSEKLRQLCDKEDLLAFDGRLAMVEELVLDYYSDNRKEKLIINRKESSLSYLQDIDGMKLGISIDDKDIRPLFDDIRPQQLISGKSDSLRSYSVSFTMSDGQKICFTGAYDASSLSCEFISFIESIQSIIASYNTGDIFNRSIYSNIGHSKGDYMLCKVMIRRLRKEYYYLSLVDDLCKGDDVIVPGIDNDEQYIGEIKKISFCREKELPCSVFNMRFIERRCVKEDYEFMDEMFY